jgi:serine phosphatase RsbU (regulator of sigma subunit)
LNTLNLTSSIRQISETSAAYRGALLRSERKRIFAVVFFLLSFGLLVAVRIFVFGSAMRHYGLLAATILIAFELWLLRIVNRTLKSDQIVPRFLWYGSIAVESLFPAVGIAFFASSRLPADYRPLATPWVLAYFPLILLSVLRLNPRLSCFSGFVSALGYLAAAYIVGWRFDPRNGFATAETAVPFFAFLLLITGILAAGVTSEIRSHVEATLREAETHHKLKEVEHELQIARSIQQSLLPKLRPQIPGFAVAGWSQSAEDTGGDFYDWKRLSSGRWVVILADVTGHGIGPAMLASVCRAYSRASFNDHDNLETTLQNINRSFAEDLTPERFATFVAAVFQEGSDQVELLSAGHGPLFIYSACDQSLQYMYAQALPLGIVPEMASASPVKLSMQPGDMVLLITDGFFEWENPAQEEFGTKRLAEVLRRFSDREPEIIIAELYDSVVNFAQGTPQKDDLTAVLIKRLAAPNIPTA